MKFRLVHGPLTATTTHLSSIAVPLKAQLAALKAKEKTSVDYVRPQTAICSAGRESIGRATTNNYARGACPPGSQARGVYSLAIFANHDANAESARLECDT